jgi:hypothetical protein
MIGPGTVSSTADGHLAGEYAVAVERLLTHIRAGRFGLQNSVVCPTDLVPSGEGFLDDLQLVVHSGLQLENDAAIADGFGFEDYVALTAIGDRVARV